MTNIKTIKEIDVFPERNSNEKVEFEDRLTGKVIVFDKEDNIALVGNKVNPIFVLPGGGIDKNESIEEGVARECLEEAGCRADLVKLVGVIDDYRNRDRKHCISYCYIAKVVGEKGDPQLTEEEKNNGLYVKWVNLDEAIKILTAEVDEVKRGGIKFYNTCFNIIRDHLFLLEAKKHINK